MNPTKLPPMKFVFIDTETTSLARPGSEPTGRVTEFCGIPVDVSIDSCQQTWRAPVMNVRREDKVHFRLQLTEEDLVNSDPESLRVNGYINDVRKFNATTGLNDTETKRLWLLATDVMADRIIVSQNAAFDIQFVEKELRLYGLDLTKRWQRKFVELWSLSAIAQLVEFSYDSNSEDDKALIKAWQNNNIISLSHAANLGNDEPNKTSKAHTADGDVEFGIQLFERFMKHMTWL